MIIELQYTLSCTALACECSRPRGAMAGTSTLKAASYRGAIKPPLPRAPALLPLSCPHADIAVHASSITRCKTLLRPTFFRSWRTLSALRTSISAHPRISLSVIMLSNAQSSLEMAILKPSVVEIAYSYRSVIVSRESCYAAMTLFPRPREEYR
jgi:hypothetical protein